MELKEIRCRRCGRLLFRAGPGYVIKTPIICPKCRVPRFLGHEEGNPGKLPGGGVKFSGSGPGKTERPYNARAIKDSL
jgi:phage FluMu protein Com